MATFNINLPYSFVNGTAANDTFNINASTLSRRLGWTETTCSPSLRRLCGILSTAAQAMTASVLAALPALSFSAGMAMTACSSTSGLRNNFSGGAGNDWLGIGGGAISHETTRRR